MLRRASSPPCIALAPQEGESVVDLAATPGGSCKLDLSPRQQADCCSPHCRGQIPSGPPLRWHPRRASLSWTWLPHQVSAYRTTGSQALTAGKSTFEQEQRAASFLPCIALAPQEGESVVYLAAALGVAQSDQAKPTQSSQLASALHRAMYCKSGSVVSGSIASPSLWDAPHSGLLWQAAS